MSFMQWFWKYGYFVIPLIVALIWFATGEKFQNRNQVNPEVFEFIKKIDRQCDAENFDNQSKACSEIAKYKADCLKISSSCDSKSHYELLRKLGFDAPVYYR